MVLQTLSKAFSEFETKTIILDYNRVRGFGKITFCQLFLTANAIFQLHVAGRVSWHVKQDRERARLIASQPRDLCLSVTESAGGCPELESRGAGCWPSAFLTKLSTQQTTVCAYHQDGTVIGEATARIVVVTSAER